MINKLVKEVVDIAIKEAKKKHNIEKIQEDILSPLIDFILEKIKPYVIGTSIFLIVITLLVIIILYIILSSGNKKIDIS